MRRTALTAAPSVNIKPIVGGVEMTVRYITRAPQRYEVKSRLFQKVVEMLHRSAGAAKPTSAWRTAFWERVSPPESTRRSASNAGFPTAQAARWKSGDGRKFLPALRQKYPDLEVIPIAELDLNRGALRSGR